MTNNQSIALIIPPHTDPSLPLLGSGQICAFAREKNIEISVYNLALNIRRLDIEPLHKLYQKNITHAQYWNSIQEHMKHVKKRYQSMFPNIIPSWDSYSYSPYQWNDFAEYDKYLFDRLNNSIIQDFYQSQDFLSKKYTYAFISVMFPSQLFEGLFIAQLLKSSSPKTIVVIGGGLINSCISTIHDVPKSIAKCTDWISLGECEYLLYAIAKYSPKNIEERFGQQHFQFSNNYLIDSSVIFREERCSLITPQPIFDDLDLYMSPKKIIPYRLSSKCYWNKCSFCTEHSYQSLLNNRSIFEQIDYIEKMVYSYHVNGIMFQDSAIHPVLLRQLSKEISKRKLVFNWGINARFDSLLTDSLISQLSDSGCRFLRFGLESASPKILQMMNKGIMINEAQRILAQCRKEGILTHVYCITGFPSESLEDAQLTKKFLLNQNYYPDSFNFSKFLSYYVSPLNGGTIKCIHQNNTWSLTKHIQYPRWCDGFIKETEECFSSIHPLHKTLISPAHLLSLYDSVISWNA